MRLNPTRLLVALMAGGLAAGTALAVPLEVQHQGRIFGATGIPLTSTHSLTFTLWNAPAGGTSEWTSTQGVEFDNGYFSATLGDSSNPIDESVADGQDLWLGISVDGGTEMTRIAISSVPYAIHAEEAQMAVSVDGGTANATSITVSGKTIVDSSGNVDWSNLSNVPTDLGSDTLADLSSSCTTGQIITYDGTDWACAAFEIDAAQVTTGKLDINRLPVGTTDQHVAPGDHTHGAADITGGQFDIARIPTGTDGASVSLGNHNHNAADLNGATLDGLSCSTAGEVAVWDGSAWGCAVPSGGSGPSYPAGGSDGPKMYAGWHGDLCRSSANIYAAGLEFPFNFDQAPVVLLNIDDLLDNGGASYTRVRRTTKNRTYIQCDNRSEGLNVFAIERGVHTIDGKMVQAGIINSATTGQSLFFTPQFPSGVKPVVFVQTGGTASYQMVRGTPAQGGFQYYLNTNGQPLHWVAFEPGTYNYGPYTFEVDQIADTQRRTRYDFGQTFPTLPTLLLTMEDTNANLSTHHFRARRVNTGNFQYESNNTGPHEFMNYLAISIDK